MFGGISRPYSDLLAVIEDTLDNTLYGYAHLSKAYLPLHKRDILMIYGERGCFVIYSRRTSRHLPCHVFAKMAEVIDGELTDDVVVDIPTLVDLNDDRWQLRQVLHTGNFVDPVAILLPPIQESELAHIPADVTFETVQILLNKEQEVHDQVQEQARPKKIFLSHKSIDKAIVRDVCLTLKEIGFDPWLDEDRMTAGANLEREIKHGMVESCAAVFFITPSFSDKDWIASEVDHAMSEKRKKNSRFAIVPLLLTSPDGKRGNVLEIFEQYLHKDVEYHQIVREILRAIPIRMTQSVEWKDGV
ncbi:toll/interleukin-1 receptor domain-containing protein [Burkholderia sp. LA-2-3-30-S1-D2]|uniref:toll/interleukin-1 receptor domain-containing protein n=1 Tax=Burkholderia sp. LA-2-3-30-S1-D2 TaxID=1637862 RepID=UPI00131EE978|nr:toll/interleukin-1 receptor domain-containing protein [Burkholderia sp. LA-2-3-30-S1-D2]